MEILPDEVWFKIFDMLDRPYSDYGTRKLALSALFKTSKKMNNLIKEYVLHFCNVDNKLAKVRALASDPMTCIGYFMEEQSPKGFIGLHWLYNDPPNIGHKFFIEAATEMHNDLVVCDNRNGHIAFLKLAAFTFIMQVKK